MSSSIESPRGQAAAPAAPSPRPWLGRTLRRLGYGLAMYALMVVAYSVLFNAMAEQTLRSQIDEQVNQEMLLAKNVNAEQRDRLAADKRTAKERLYHLDQPLPLRIFWRSVDTLAFNYGNASTMKSADGERAVAGILLAALPNTVALFSLQVLLTLLAGVPLGLAAARRPDGWIDRLCSGLTMVTNGLPAWWLGMLAIMAFAAGGLGWFPSGGLHGNPAPEGWAGAVDYLWHLALPLLTLVLLGVWGTAYMTRNIVLGNLQEDFVVAARARGVPERRVLANHALRSSLPAIMTITVLSLFSSISGNIVFEGIFAWPGLGNVYFQAVQSNDMPVLMANLALQTLINMAGFVLLDLIYGWLDPRIRAAAPAGGRP